MKALPALLASGLVISAASATAQSRGYSGARSAEGDVSSAQETVFDVGGFHVTVSGDVIMLGERTLRVSVGAPIRPREDAGWSFRSLGQSVAFERPSGGGLDVLRSGRLQIRARAPRTLGLHDPVVLVLEIERPCATFDRHARECTTLIRAAATRDGVSLAAEPLLPGVVLRAMFARGEADPAGVVGPILR